VTDKDQQDGDNRRQDERVAVAWVSRLVLVEEDKILPCRVVDVSTAGTKVECDQAGPLTEGTELILSIQDLGEFAATVAWHRPPGIGLKIMAGPDLLLKRFAEAGGASPSRSPSPPEV